jgi:hypothetical protein
MSDIRSIVLREASPVFRGSPKFCQCAEGPTKSSTEDSTEGHRPRNTHQGISPLHGRYPSIYITHSTSELVNPPSWSVSAKTTYSLINATCLNNKTCDYLTEKVESSLPFPPIILTSSEASDALLRHSTYLLRH